jgi:hypothetical protein
MKAGRKATVELNPGNLKFAEEEIGAVEWIRTTTVFLPPAPQAGASANSATTAPQ